MALKTDVTLTDNFGIDVTINDVYIKVALIEGSKDQLTANVFYYNRNVTAEGELAQIAEYVASVHLKDTDGGFESWHFPALGEGVVNFRACIDLLEQRGFSGPFTLELEGIKGEELTEALAKERVEVSIRHLREIGLIGP